MNNLASLRNELRDEYTEEDSHSWNIKNYYQHHNMPIRSFLKTSEAKQKGKLLNIIHLTPNKSGDKKL